MFEISTRNIDLQPTHERENEKGISSMNSNNINNPATTIAAQFLISAAARPILIEAEVARRSIGGFVEEYNDLTGETLSWQTLSAGGHAMDMGYGKWGTEVRIYFPRDELVANQMRRYGFTVDDGGIRMGDSNRINNRDLFRELVDVHGLRIGDNL